IRPYSPTAPKGDLTDNRVRELERRDSKGKQIFDNNGNPKMDTWRNVKNPPSPNPQGHWVEGFFCKSNHNIKNKHDERIFFNAKGKPEMFPLEQAHIDNWAALIMDYRLEHDDGNNGLKPLPDDVPDWSRHIRNYKQELELKEGDLCYARVRQAGAGWELVELYPVMLSRRLHRLTPKGLLPDSLRSAREIEELSPADRVFGWVNQNGKGAYRGQLRIGTIECKTAVEDAINYLTEDPNLERKELGLPLSILGAPKPQQGRFYVAKDKEGEAQERGLNNELAGYTDKDENGNEIEKGLRGRKVYPHYANLPDDYWENPTDPDLTTQKTQQGFYKEYRRRRDEHQNEQRDTQNRSMQAWVTEGTTFEFDIHVTNLSDVELGALLWLLKLNEGKPEPDHYFRLGGGKPLGFGSVVLELTGGDVRDGSAWREYYESLNAKAYDPNYRTGEHLRVTNAANQKKRDFNDLIQAYKEAILKAYPRDAQENFNQVSFIAAFLRAATGYVKRKETDKELPIHYPRARHATDDTGQPLPPHQDGLAYEWFVENNKQGKLALPKLDDDEGLPVFTH
ncbi:MAG: TIGR03986 family type III CRISPR-associated RAMP protein, partial [Pyrinomonadaceae bacterium]